MSVLAIFLVAGEHLAKATEGKEVHPDSVLGCTHKEVEHGACPIAGHIMSSVR